MMISNRKEPVGLHDLYKVIQRYGPIYKVIGPYLSHYSDRYLYFLFHINVLYKVIQRYMGLYIRL